MVQPDIKKLVAYSSVSHLGFIVLGIFSFTIQGLEGAIYQMLNHGISTGALFLLVGVIYDRRHTRLIEEFGGLANRMPVYATFFLIVTLSSFGLPGLNGFVGEFLVLLGTFGVNHIRAAVAALGVILSAVYMLWMYQRVMWGRVENDRNASLADLAGRERAMLVPILIMIFWMGMYSSYFLRPMDASVMKLLNQTQAGRVEYARDLNTFPSAQRRARSASPIGRSLKTRSASPIGRSLKSGCAGSQQAGGADEVVRSALHVFAELTTPALQPFLRLRPIGLALRPAV